ncbi:MAG: bifunctional UDP-N-acetylmuramoyl-tripeptide:D-alanyl-D-alanine ligase/alanine racemase [Bacteroidales bacterium]|nr:bifunctional UDP-N-acetylmuramoyl-tripeptide:D-alanyl-D-alanine ligase/alanine racemase [Bacteroidales bacterium]MCF8333103.1 bifunctional UDP-N-acetylmuramoyl-tripeptide:D-alanyl-D-alanine ligase/alanine racemase [Bacteroidales bacterium]
MTSSHEYNLSDVAQIVKGELYLQNPRQSVVNDILIDSRKLISGPKTLFFAIRTGRNDGHHYIEELYEKDVRNFVVSKEEIPSSFPEANFVIVENSLQALHKLATHHRKQFSFPFIGITGSNGKTIVKEWLFQLLQEDYNIIRSPKSYNSQIGVPLSVWQVNDENDLGIFEAGISEPEEMGNLQSIIQPTIGVFTNIGPAHDKNFISDIQKAGEKLKLFTHVHTMIYSPDYDAIREVMIRSGLKNKVNTLTWSRNNTADMIIREVTKDKSHTEIKAVYENEVLQIKIPFTDEASVENAIHCWAVMWHMGYDNNTIAQRMQNLQTIAMRLELKEGINDCSVINDSYNSDLNSLNIALDILNRQKQHKKKTVILSDILQTNRSSFELYDEIADILQKKGVNKLIGIGEAISRHANFFSMEKSFFKNTDEFIRSYPFSGFNDEAILIKGARIFEFERISNALQQKDHETVLEINLNALINNLNYYRKMVDQEVKIMAMVKAFSYGSGSYEISNTLQYHNIDYLSVAYADEGVELRKSGIYTPIMVMNPDEQSFDAILKYQLEPEIYSFRIFKRLEEAIERNLLPKNKPVKIHIKLDTGMHRLGFLEEEVEVLINRIKENDLIRVQSVFSHLAASDEGENDDFTRSQIDLFRKLSDTIQQAFDYKILRHILNSAGISRFPNDQFDMVRLGISMYGIATDHKVKNELQNVSSLRSSISQIKTVKPGGTVGYSRQYKAEEERKIATVPVGYADGLSRLLSNGKASLILHGQKVPIVGNICMDMCMIDVTGMDVQEGDKVEIFGENQPVNVLADKMGTIPYEILAGISRRVKRIYYQE